MNLTKNFTLAEFIETQHRNIDNTLPEVLMDNAIQTCEMLERIREYLSDLAGKSVPMIITSGYRCPALNTAVGSSSTSDHVKALAADWKAPAFGSPYQICMALQRGIDSLRIGQLIHEYGSWIHTGLPRPQKLVNRILTISKAGTSVGIHRI